MSNDNSQIKVSVLIPVYGVEKYIERCARSLFEQTMREGIEFIFTDDCTPDGSIAILEKVLNDYPERKPQVRIIHHDTNKGLAVARVTGVNAARGEYVIHCDSDDWVEPDMYELMHAKAKETDADIVVCGVIEEHEQWKRKIKPLLNKTSRDFAMDIFNHSGVRGYLWNRLIRRIYYLRKEFISNPAVSLFEDIMLTIPMHLTTDRNAIIPYCLYHYNLCNQSSIVHSLSEKNFKSGLIVIEMLKSYIIDDPILYHVWRQFRLFFLMQLIYPNPFYNPKKWIEEKGDDSGLRYTIRGRISAFLVKNGAFRINLTVQKMISWLRNKIM